LFTYYYLIPGEKPSPFGKDLGIKNPKSEYPSATRLPDVGQGWRAGRNPKQTS